MKRDKGNLLSVGTMILEVSFLSHLVVCKDKFWSTGHQLMSKTVPILQVEGIRSIEIANSPDPGHNMRKRKTVPIQLILIVLLIRTLLFKFDAVKVELWDESPECLPAARQNACENSLFGCEKGEDMGEERVW